MPKREKGPHDIYSELTITVRHHLPNAASPTEAEQQIEERLDKQLPNLKSFMGGDVVESELLNVAAEPTGARPEFSDEEDYAQGQFDW